MNLCLSRACLLALASLLPVAEPIPAAQPLLAAQPLPAAELQPKTLQAWKTYVRLTEQRIAAELEDKQRFLVTDFLPQAEAEAARELLAPYLPKLRDGTGLAQGGVYIQRMETREADGRQVKVEDGIIHHWFGAVFLPNTTLAELLPWLQDYDRHEKFFLEVERSRLLARSPDSGQGDTFKIFLRLRRKKVITVYYHTDHTVIYRRHDPRRVSSRSFTTRVVELDNPGTPAEKEKPEGKDRGFFWRLNSYWRFQEAPGGVTVECESISLSRSIPFGLAWLIKRYIESIPRESLANTLTAIRNRKEKTAQAGEAAEP